MGPLIVVYLIIVQLLQPQVIRIEQLEKELAEAHSYIIHLEQLQRNQPTFRKEFDITVTSYTSLSGLTDSTPWTTASGTTCSPKTLAISQDLLQEYTGGAAFAYGDTAYLIFGPYIIEDTMAKRKKRCADVWTPSLECARSFGIERDVMIYVVES